MAENKMEKVAALLGIKLDEEFKVKGHTYKYKLIKSGLKYLSDISSCWEDSCILENLLAGEWEIIKLPKQILDKEEKAYLSEVIKPFRNRILYIRKISSARSEFIEVVIKHYNNKDVHSSFTPPLFKKGTMYKGMEPYKEYTLKELKL